MVRSVRTWTALLVMSLCLTVAAGCRKKSRRSSHSGGSGTFSGDSFPGKPVAKGNVADDLKGFSPSGTDVILDSIRCTPNGASGKMIVTYGVRSVPGGPESLIAHAFDGDVWTPPVALTSTDAIFSAGSVSYSGITHVWLNTSAHPADAAQDRDGDCLIVWNVRDADEDGAATADGVNRSLYMSYFNSRHAKDPGARYGFQEFATRLNTRDEAGEDVTAFGVLTDGIRGEARWATDDRSYECGEQTSGIVVFWNQRENNDGVAGAEDRALYARHVALDAAVADDLPLTLGAGVGAEMRIAIHGLGASDSGSSSEETQVDHHFVSYNGFLAFRVCANNTTAGDDLPTLLFDPAGSDYNGTLAFGEDAVLQGVTFDLFTGVPSAAIVLHSVTPVTSALDTLQNNADFLQETPARFVEGGPFSWGPDEGLAVLVFLNAETVQDTNTVQTDAGDTTGIGLSEIDVTTGALLSHVLVNANDPAIPDFIDSRLVSARISRNGDYLWVAWLQADDDGLSDDLMVKGAQYLTTRPDSDGDFVLPPLAATLGPPSDLAADADGFDVASFAFQDGLGYICGAQSDPDVMNIAIAHPDATADRLLVARLRADLITPVVPVVTVSLLETDDFPVYSLAPAINDGGLEFRITDSGEGGNVFAVYNADVDVTIGSDIRVAAERTGLAAGAGPIDSNVLFRQAGHQAFTFLCTPPGKKIGAFDTVTLNDDEERAHPAEQIHVLFREQESSEFSMLGLALRTRVFNTDDTDNLFGDSFVPAAGALFALPFDLDLPFLDPPATEDAEVIGTCLKGTQVGIYFTELGHIYYQEYQQPSKPEKVGWQNAAGASKPFLVDDDVTEETSSAEPVGFFQLFVVRSCTCETLRDSTVFYTKSSDDFSTAERLYVRTRD